MELVSVYITVKNGLPYIKDSVDSIVLQTYKNWELVIVDDGSTDGTTEYLRSIEGENKRFNFIFTEGVGRSAALNMAVQHSKGYFIANLDADDVASPYRLEKQARILTNKQEIDLLCSKAVISFGDEHPVWKKGDGTVNSVSKKLFINNPINHSSIMMRKEVFLKSGGYNQKLDKNIDYDFWCRIFINNYGIYKVNHYLVSKRIHQNQSFENRERLKYLCSSFKIRCDFIRKNNASSIYYILIGFGFFYGLIPQKIRMCIAKYKHIFHL